MRRQTNLPNEDTEGQKLWNIFQRLPFASEKALRQHTWAIISHVVRRQSHVTRRPGNVIRKPVNVVRKSGQLRENEEFRPKLLQIPIFGRKPAKPRAGITVNGRCPEWLPRATLNQQEATERTEL